MIVGRDEELARLSALIEGARGGHGCTVAVVGPAGIGKSHLVAHAAPEATGLAGVQAERDVPYAGLSALALPLLGHLPSLVDVQRAALETVLGLRDGVQPGRLVLGTALLGLLASAAEESGLVVVIDDLQWVDRPSQDALVFAARRLSAERLAMVFTVRADPGGADLVAGLPCIDLGGLPLERSTDLVAGVHPKVAQALNRLAAGNPLAMIEAARSLDPDEARGLRPLPRRLASTSPEQSYAAQLNELSAPVRRAARLAALAGDSPREVTLEALRSSGLSLADLAPLETIGLVTIGDRGTWRHPLVRSAAARGTTEELTAAHRELAAAWLAVSPSHPARAWHLAESTTGADADVVDALVAAAELAEQRDASADAADAYERAARFSADAGQRTALLGRAGGAATRAGFCQRAADLIQEALREAPEGEPAARLFHARGRLEAVLGRPANAFDWYRKAIELTADGSLAMWAAAESIHQAQFAARPDLARWAAEAAAARQDPDDPVHRFLATWTGAVAARLNHDREACRTGVDRAWAIAQEHRLLDAEPALLLFTLSSELHADRPTPLRAPELAAIRRLRLVGDLTWLPQIVRLSAYRQTATGALEGVYAAHEESALLARLSGQEMILAESLLALAELDAHRADAETCLARVREAAELVTRHDMRWQDGWADLVTGVLHLSLGDPAEAVTHLRQAAAKGEWCLPELAYALRATGSAEAARAEIAQHEQSSEPLWNDLGAAVADLDDGRSVARIDALFGELHFPFDIGFFHLVAGERLLHAGDESAARERFTSAARQFRAIGAPPWLAKAEDALQLSGATLQVRVELADEHLTSSERRVATMVAEGRSNKEVAAILFLSPRTVQSHLAAAYRKIGVNNRTALARALAP